MAKPTPEQRKQVKEYSLKVIKQMQGDLENLKRAVNKDLVLLGKPSLKRDIFDSKTGDNLDLKIFLDEVRK